MVFKDLGLKFQEFRSRDILKGDDYKNVKKPSWMMPITHGHHVVEDQSWRGEDTELDPPDYVVVLREEMGNLELWFYCVSDARIGDGISKHLQLNFFGKNYKESLVSGKSEETIRKSYIDARAKIESDNQEKMVNVGCVSAMVINGEKIVLAQMGGYRAIVCRDGLAHQLRATHQYRGIRHWPHRLISGGMCIPKLRTQACHSSRKHTKSSKLTVCTERIDSETEFIILASTGILEVMRNQEAVDLIRYIDDPEEAAECLSREAMVRMSRSVISCLVIRFD